MSGPGRNVGVTGNGEQGTEKMKKKCEECEKDAVIIENKKYYCPDCYIDRFVRVHERLRFKSLHDSIESTNQGK